MIARLLLLFTLAAASAAAQQPLRVWAYDGLKPQLERWESAYTAQHPEVHFTNTYHGAAAVMAGLYDGVADFTLMGREIWPVETMAYRWVYQAQPFGLAVATAGLNAPGQAFTPVVIVNKSNPIATITLSQLDAIYASEHRAAPANIRTWGDLGLTGPIATHAIHVYGFGGEDPLGVYFRHDVLKMDFKPNPASHLYTDTEQSLASKKVATPRNTAAMRIAAAVAADPYAIGYTSALAAHGTKIIPVANIAPSSETLADRTYPMTRSAWLFFRRTNDKPLDPRIDAFVRFVLSPEGQAVVQSKDGFLPLTPKMQADQIHKLEAPIPAAGVTEE